MKQEYCLYCVNIHHHINKVWLFLFGNYRILITLFAFRPGGIIFVEY